MAALPMKSRLGRNVVGILVGGFALIIALLLFSGASAIRALESTEARAAAAHEQHRMTTDLVDDLQREESGLSAIFYALVAGPRPVDRPTLLARLDAFETDVTATLESARGGPNAERWAAVGAAISRFTREVRALLESPEDPIEEHVSLFRANEALISDVSQLVAATHTSAVEAEARLHASAEERMHGALALLGLAVCLSLVGAGATVRVVGRMFRRSEWQSRELSRLSSHVLDTQEQMLAHLSRELHDELGQSLTAIEANLSAIPGGPADTDARVEDCVLLVQDAMSKVRELSQLFRPSTLDDFGLVPSLQLLVESFSQRTGVAVETAFDVDGRLDRQAETHLFRIAQEALTNIARHSGATRARMSLERRGKWLRLEVSDHGRGLSIDAHEKGLGLIGMRERALAAGGRFHVTTDERGARVLVEVPFDEGSAANADPCLAGG